MVLCRVVFLAANLCRQDGDHRMVVCDDALRNPMEGSSQTLPRGLEREVGQKFRQPSYQVRASFIVTFIGGTGELHPRVGLVSRILPRRKPAFYASNVALLAKHTRSYRIVHNLRYRHQIHRRQILEDEHRSSTRISDGPGTWEISRRYHSHKWVFTRPGSH